jgi:hypothetical protein
MPVNDGVPGVGVTPLHNGAAVTAANPLPVTSAAGGGFGPGVVVGDMQAAIFGPGLAAGVNILLPPVPGKSYFVTGYNFSLNTADNCGFFSNGVTPASAQGVGVLGGSEAIGSEPYLFATAAGATLTFNCVAAHAAGNVQFRYRLQQ